MRLASWRSRYPVVFSAVVATALAGAVSTLVYMILSSVDAPGWARIVAAAAVFAMTQLAAVVKEVRDARKDATKADEAAAAAEAVCERSAARLMRVWPPRRLDAVDMFDLGVRRPAVQQAEYPYVARDVEEGAVRALRKSGVLLVVGEAVSGATRTAYQVAVRCFPRFVVLAPRALGGGDVDVVLGAIDRLGESPLVLLWLDRLESVAAGCDDGVLSEVAARVDERGGRLRVVATAGAGFEAWGVDHPQTVDWFGSRIVVRRTLSGGERGRVERLYPGVDSAGGIGVALTELRELTMRADAGRRDCPFHAPGESCDVVTDLLSAAVSVAATGATRGVAVDSRWWTTQAPADEHVAESVAWLQAPVVSANGLVIACEDPVGYVRVDSDLGAALFGDDGVVAAHVWEIVAADAAEAGDWDCVGRIGFTAVTKGADGCGMSAWSRVVEYSSPAYAWLSKAYDAACDGGDLGVQLVLANETIRLRSGHPELLGQYASALVAKAYITHELGLYDDAIGSADEVLRVLPSTLPQFDERRARATVWKTSALLVLGMPTQAIEEVRDRFDASHGAISPLTCALLLGVLGKGHTAVGSVSAAIASFQAALASLDLSAVDHSTHRIEVLVPLAAAERACGDTGAARKHAFEALALFPEATRDSEYLYQQARFELAATFVFDGDVVRGLSEMSDAWMKTCQLVGASHLYALSMSVNIANFAVMLGQYVLAMEVSLQSLSVLFPDGGDTAAVAHDLGVGLLVPLAVAQENLGDLPGAQATVDDLLRLFATSSARVDSFILPGLAVAGKVAYRRRDFDAAHTHWQRALDFAAEFEQHSEMKPLWTRAGLITLITSVASGWSVLPSGQLMRAV